MVHDSLETSIKAKDTMWIKHVYGQQLQYQPEKKKMNTVDSVLQHTAITKEYLFPMKFLQEMKIKNLRVETYKTKQKLFSFLIIFVHTPS